jgi:3-hydroxybutyryl-CoA dehydrogenase
VKTIGVIGARAAGRAIAYAAAVAGYRTVLEDVSPEMLEQGMDYVRQSLQAAVERGELTQQLHGNALANISIMRSVEAACREADLLIEACPEELELKLEIFTLFDRFAKPDAILASNSSTVSISDLAAITFRAENCVGLQFVNPYQKVGLVNIIRSQETSDATVIACKEVARRMGKEAIVMSEQAQA